MSNPEQMLYIDQDGAGHEFVGAQFSRLPRDTASITAFRRRAAEEISCSALTRCRAASAKAARRGRSTRRLRTARAKAGASLGETRRPVTPCTTISLTPPAAPATTDTPLAC